MELGVDQALDDGENKRGREAEHQHSGYRFKWSQQLPSWRQYDVGTHSRVAASR